MAVASATPAATVPAVMERIGTALRIVDSVILAAFVVALALAPASGPLAVFRALRVLRILRLVSAIPRMRFLAESLVKSLPGLGSIGTLLLIFFYVFGVAATKLFGANFPIWFGSLPASMFSLFQIMTLEGWAEIAREVMTVYPAAWLFFVVFILLATFTVLNLFIGLIVKVMEEPAAGQSEEDLPVTRRDIEKLRVDVASLRAAVVRQQGSPMEDATRADAL